MQSLADLFTPQENVFLFILIHFGTTYECNKHLPYTNKKKKSETLIDDVWQKGKVA